MSSERKSTWRDVFDEFERQLDPTEQFDLPVEKRNRSTMQCQRLLPDRRVHLAVPVILEATSGQKKRSDALVAFTDGGPVLFEASRGNPALPRNVVGPIDGDEIELTDHDRHGGVLTIGTNVYLVRNVYAPGLRSYLGVVEPEPETPDV